MHVNRSRLSAARKADMKQEAVLDRLPGLRVGVHQGLELRHLRYLIATCHANSSRSSSTPRRARLPGPVRDPQVVPGRVEDPEIPQAPRAVTEILGDRPSRRCDLVALGHDIVDFEHQLHPGGRQPRGAGIWHRPPGGSDAHTAPLERDVRAGLVTPIGDQAETQDAHIELDGGAEIIRKDLEPQCHLHDPMMALVAVACRVALGRVELIEADQADVVVVGGSQSVAEACTGIAVE